jgi:hypothetical protein
MLRQLGWGRDYLAPPPRSRVMGRPRWRLLAVTALTVVVVGFLAGLTGTKGGLVALGLAVVLVVLLGMHHASGRRWLVRAAAEYAVVAVLVVLLAGHFSPHPAPAAKHPARPKPAAAAPARPRPAACPGPSLKTAPKWIACIWHAAMDPAPPPTTTRPRGGHR